jgi:large subunit ribosomal protein L5
MPRLKDRYRTEVVPALVKEFNYRNAMQAPRPVKVVINMGVGTAVQDSKTMDAAVRDMTAIAGQKPVITRARRSIAAFKIRQGMRIGCMVTLRGDRMWYFLDKLFNVVMPRIRDFGGINPNAFDGHGNFATGLREQLVFPEIDYDAIDRIRGMDIAITTTAKTDEEGRALLRALGLPFRSETAAR